MTSVSCRLQDSGESSVSIEADTPAELFAEVAMLVAKTSPDSLGRAGASARNSTLPVVQWAKELEAGGYRDLSVRRRSGRWHAELVLH